MDRRTFVGTLTFGLLASLLRRPGGDGVMSRTDPASVPLLAT